MIGGLRSNGAAQTWVLSRLSSMTEKVRSVVQEFRRRDALLYGLGISHLLVLAIVLILMPFDDRLVTGEDPWVKPAKFALANATFLLTAGWLVFDLRLPVKISRRLTRAVGIAITSETVLITLQAARGTSSHFNMTSPFNTFVQALMGVLIVLNTVAVGYIAWKYWRGRPSLPPAYLWGVRLGLLIFLLASIEGFAMVANRGHAVGTSDGGPGLPIVNWSTVGGDLRIAHFFGLHALQVLPVIGAVLSRLRFALFVTPAFVIIAVGIAYGLFALLLFVSAMAGRPLF